MTTGEVVIYALIVWLIVSAGVGWALMVGAGILGTSIGFDSAWATGLLIVFAHRLLSAGFLKD